MMGLFGKRHRRLPPSIEKLMLLLDEHGVSYRALVIQVIHGFVDVHNLPPRLMKTAYPEEAVLERQQVQQHIISPPAQEADYSPSHGIQDKVICSRDDGGQNHQRVGEAHGSTCETVP